MARILIEFFSAESAENTAAFLYGKYDRVIYFSFAGEEPESRQREVLEELIPGRFGTQVSFLTVQDKTLSGAYREFYNLMRDGDEYVFDLTGGSQLFSAAVGIFISASERENISAALFDIEKGREYLQYPQCAERAPESFFGVDELISLTGGKVVSKSKTYGEIREKSALRTEIMRMWDAVKGLLPDWNRFCSMTNYREGNRVRKKLSRADDRKTVERLTGVLRRRDIIKNDRLYIDERGRTFLEYDLSPRAKTVEMYEKSGTVLELYTCTAAGECGSFTEVCSGVMLDLDGLITKKRGDPANEIDVTAVYKNRLVLVSCKNCKPTKEHLYEILTMAEQYGGKYAIPALVCSEPAFEPVRERASEMGVILIDNVYDTPLKKLKDIFVRYFPSDRRTDDEI